ncbi:metallohydrolase [Halomonas sp. MMSF_3323]|uniref:metallohydrolase n=1 Tax=Halomonas sp. MMSF_3323 TaxID=3046701 RepID=UPI00273E1600|nr:metallohydrolase [Halomonas sp. MMSF_3323]
MPTTLTFFPVGNGDMTLIKFGDGVATTLMIDVNIRQDADDPNGDAHDVARDLRERLKRDDKGRPYVDAFLLSHPDEDHCRGITRHFHLGPLDEYPDDDEDDQDKRIVIREIWSSPIVFRRKKKDSPNLCPDAEAFAKEARRRVSVNRKQAFIVGEGDRILILGEDVEGKTDDLGSILIKVDERFSRINGKESSYFSGLLLAPLEVKDEESEEDSLAKNRSSTIINFTLAADASTPDGANFVTGGDAEVFIWNRLWEHYESEAEALSYDLLQAPHHCSWHSLSHDSWSDDGEDAEVDEGARNALSQARDGAIIVASCNPIEDDDNDPPCIRAKREYQDILKDGSGDFYCTGDDPNSTLVFTVTADGIQPPSKKESGSKAAAVISSARTPMPHGAS